jgi:hypothetical protein
MPKKQKNELCPHVNASAAKPEDFKVLSAEQAAQKKTCFHGQTGDSLAERARLENEHVESRPGDPTPQYPLKPIKVARGRKMEQE